MMRAKLMAVVLAAAVSWTAAAAQQPTPAVDYPTRPIRFICPYVPGGAGDIFTRTIGRKLSEALGQTVVVYNRPGANGGIGTGIVPKSAPDGYTLLMGNSGPLTVNSVLYRKVPYDPIKDFAPITQGTYVLVVPPSLPAASLKEFVAVLKARPGQMPYGSTGIGGGNHLSGELFNLMTGTQSVHVPHTGSAASLAALLGGQINYMFDTVIASVPHVRSGRLRALG